MMTEAERGVRRFQHGRNQAFRIARGFELEGDEAIVRNAGDRPLIEPARKVPLRAFLASLEPVDELFPHIDAHLHPSNDVEV